MEVKNDAEAEMMRTLAKAAREHLDKQKKYTDRGQALDYWALAETIVDKYEELKNANRS